MSTILEQELVRTAQCKKEKLTVLHMLADAIRIYEEIIDAFPNEPETAEVRRRLAFAREYTNNATRKPKKRPKKRISVKCN